VWFVCGLTFELTWRRRYDARPALQTMHACTVAQALWHAVGSQVERGVRPHSQCLLMRYSLFLPGDTDYLELMQVRLPRLSTRVPFFLPLRGLYLPGFGQGQPDSAAVVGCSCGLWPLGDLDDVKSEVGPVQRLDCSRGRCVRLRGVAIWQGPRPLWPRRRALRAAPGLAS